MRVEVFCIADDREENSIWLKKNFLNEIPFHFKCNWIWDKYSGKIIPFSCFFSPKNVTETNSKRTRSRSAWTNCFFRFIFYVKVFPLEIYLSITNVPRFSECSTVPNINNDIAIIKLFFNTWSNWLRKKREKNEEKHPTSSFCVPLLHEKNVDSTLFGYFEQSLNVIQFVFRASIIKQSWKYKNKIFLLTIESWERKESRETESSASEKCTLMSTLLH